MEIRATQPADLERMTDIDGTVESLDYLHVEASGQGLAVGWRVEERPLRTRHIDPFAMGDDDRFVMKQIVIGAAEGLALVGEHDGMIVASVVASLDAERSALRIIDLRVDYDYRRQGLGSVLLYRTIQEARDRQLRAVVAQTRSKNSVAARFLAKAAFELTGLDVRLLSNHDLVKEEVTLFWYASLD